MENIVNHRTLTEQFGAVGQIVLLRAVRSQYKNVAVYVSGHMNPRVASFLAYMHMVENVLPKSDYSHSTVRRICTFGSMIYALDKSVVKGTVTAQGLNGEITFTPKNMLVDGEPRTIPVEHIARSSVAQILKGLTLRTVSRLGIQKDSVDRVEIDFWLPVAPTRFSTPESTLIHKGKWYGRVTKEVLVERFDDSILINLPDTSRDLPYALLSDAVLRSIIAYHIEEHLTINKGGQSAIDFSEQLETSICTKTVAIAQITGATNG